MQVTEGFHIFIQPLLADNMRVPQIRTQSRPSAHRMCQKKQNKMTSTSLFQLVWLKVRKSSLRRTGSKMPPALLKPISLQRGCSLLQIFPLPLTPFNFRKFAKAIQLHPAYTELITSHLNNL